MFWFQLDPLHDQNAYELENNYKVQGAEHFNDAHTVVEKSAQLIKQNAHDSVTTSGPPMQVDMRCQ